MTLQGVRRKFHVPIHHHLLAFKYQLVNGFLETRTTVGDHGHAYQDATLAPPERVRLTDDQIAGLHRCTRKTFECLCVFVWGGGGGTDYFLGIEFRRKWERAPPPHYSQSFTVWSLLPLHIRPSVI